MPIDQNTLHALLTNAMQHKASDVHFRPGAPPSYRVNKKLVPLKMDRLMPPDTLSVAQILGGPLFQRQNMEELQEFDTSYAIPGVSRFRVNIYKQRGSFSIVTRLIPSEIPTLEKLGLPPVLAQIADYERGLVLVTGATGSGKSTSLAAMLDRINSSRYAHILTIEDPIEYLHPNKKSSISQREVGPDTRNFNIGLRAALRQDPDVILVGEMRDAETVDIGLKASETGHMVFSTVHTTDAAKTIGRLLGVFPPEEQNQIRRRLAENLRATISQRLLPKADGKGMVVAMEIMIVTGTIREILLDPAQGSVKDVIEKSRSQYHMQSFDQHLTDLFKSGVITKEVALQAATNAADFMRNLEFQ